MRPENEVVFNAVEEEMDHQDGLFGKDKPQSLPGFLLIIRKELEEAENGWMKGTTGRHSVLSELKQVAAVAMQALKRYGTVGCPVSGNDGDTHVWYHVTENLPLHGVYVLCNVGMMVTYGDSGWCDRGGMPVIVTAWRYLTKEEQHDWNKKVLSSVSNNG